MLPVQLNGNECMHAFNILTGNFTHRKRAASNPTSDNNNDELMYSCVSGANI
jgi:hypothetical protein